MELNVVDSSKGKLKVEISGRNSLTLANLINENLWQQKGVTAAFAKKHPYMSEPEVLIKTGDPKGALKKAVQQIVKDVDVLEKQVK